MMNELKAPKYPFASNASDEIRKRGELVYLQYCFRCHDLSGEEVGRVVPLHNIGTDPGRWQSYTTKVVDIQKDYGNGYDWKWHHFAKTDGYANHPLDGIWARAPYLHNGSVPTMWDLLQPEEQRPKAFYIGHGVYDPENMGYKTNVLRVGKRAAFEFDTSLPGNSNSGHTGEIYGTELPDESKRNLIEYLKTL